MKPAPGHSLTWKITAWGTRGSISVGHSGTAKYGGHTTCFEIELPTARIFVDAGSGLVAAANGRELTDKPALMLISHLHWDHIVGFPFFSPIFADEWSLQVRGVRRENQGVFDAIAALNRPPIFPVDLKSTTRANITPTDLDPEGSLEFHGVKVRWMDVWHPGGCSAFSFDINGFRIVFTGDVELPRTDRAALLAFARGADVLVVDAQYTTDEYLEHEGWGHSSNIHAAEFAAECGVGKMYLTHHDPVHDDDFVDSMVAQAQAIFPNSVGAAFGTVLASSDFSEPQ